MLVSMVLQTMYFLVDLYWVGRLGTDSVAAVGIAGNWSFFVLALTQMLGVGTTAVISHAVGRKDPDSARLMFNQSQVLSLVIGALFLVAGLAVRMPYVRSMGADEETIRLAGEYLLWFVPAMALQFALVSMGSALRGVGNFKPTMIVSAVTIAINMALAPFLIFGWVTGHPFGVAGAAIASLISIAVGVAWMSRWFIPHEGYLRFDLSLWRPQVAAWKKMLSIGLPAGAEFAIMTVYLLLFFTILCHIVPEQMVRIFTDDPAVVVVGEEYLRIISYNYVASGLIFVAASMF